jgi:DGQHR domain-containing protein
LFQAPVGEVLEWAAIRRLHNEAKAPQREDNPAKVKSIAKYLSDEPRNTIPTAVIISLKIPTQELPKAPPSPKSKKKGTSVPTTLKIKIPAKVTDKTKPGLVIDGQHRLLGVFNFNPQTPINIVALLNADDAETAFQFLVINNKASKVSANHIKGLALEFKDEELSERLRTARLSLRESTGLVEQVDKEESSPFFGLIDWPINRTGLRCIVPAAIEGALLYAQSKIKILEDPDVLIEFFFAMWRTIKDTWPKLWKPQDSKLLDKVGIITMTTFMTDALVALSDMGNLDLADPDAVESACRAILKSHTPEFWSTPWASTSYDTKAGRQLIVDALVEARRNIRSGVKWNEDIALFDPS